jgi:hypothetical protein
MFNIDFINVTNYTNSFGNFISSLEQIIEPTMSIIFENSNNIINIDFENGTDHITILQSGIYIINLCAQFTSACQLALFINDSPELSTLIFSNSGLVSIHQIVKLEENDKISIRNYSSSDSITTIQCSQSNNINLNIIQISSFNKNDELTSDTSSEDYFIDTSIEFDKK